MAVQRGLATRASDGSVVFDLPVEAPRPEPVPTRPPAGTVVQREDASTQSPPPVPETQSVPGPSSTQQPEAGAGEDGAGAGQDLDMLAVRLYPRISRQLRLELLRERDRLGSLSDFRH